VLLAGCDVAPSHDACYEAQRYRHAEMIARSRLGRLQESVQEMARTAEPAPTPAR
jgi:hypothetical protein